MYCDILAPEFCGVIIIIEGKNKQILREVPDMITLKILPPFVVALMLLVAIASFFYCVTSALCYLGCAVLTRLDIFLFICGWKVKRRCVSCASHFRVSLWHLVHL